MPDSRLWELLARFFNDETGQEELAELEGLLEHHPDKQDFLAMIKALRRSPLERQSDFSDEIKSLTRISDAIEKEEQALLETTMEPAPGKKTGWKKYVGMIAAVIIVIISPMTWKVMNNGKQKKKTSTEGFVQVTGSSSKNRIELPDGSVVVLRGSSKLSYNTGFGTTGREMSISGEAYFDVHKNPDMPLRLHAGSIDIVVKGTAFNVRAYPREQKVEAVLFRGIIEITAKDDPDRKIQLKPNEKIVIGKTSNIEASGTKQSSDGNADTLMLTQVKPNAKDNNYDELVWMKNRLVFQSETFGSLATKMGHWFNMEFVFEDTEAANLVLTGSFQNESVQEAMDALKTVAPFTYSIEKEKVIIKKRK